LAEMPRLRLFFLVPPIPPKSAKMKLARSPLLLSGLLKTEWLNTGLYIEHPLFWTLSRPFYIKIC
jgi:hypothetical protein